MKTGIATCTLDVNGYGRWKEDTYKKIKEHGYDCSDFDIADTDSEIYTLPQEESDKILLHEKALAEEAGIEISQVHGPWRWPPRDYTKEDRAERLEKMQKSIRAASVVGCRNWVIHPIMPFGVDDLDTGDAQKTWDMNIEFMGELLKTAKEYGVTICLENMPMLRFSLSTPEQILKFVEAIDDENLKICLDTGHVSVFEELNLAEEVLRLNDKIRVLHVHDNRNSIDLHMMPYHGIIDWEAFYKALAQIGFDGSLSLETMPSKKLPTYIFEEMCISLAKITKEITKSV